MRRLQRTSFVWSVAASFAVGLVACFPPLPEEEDAVDSAVLDTSAADSAESDGDTSGPLDTTGPLDTVDTAEPDTVEPVDTVEPADTVTPLDTVELADTVTLDTVEPIDTVTPADTVTPIDAVTPVDTAECGQAADCRYLDAECFMGDCLAGQCVARPRQGGTPCDDGLFCTIHDACNGQGACLGEERVCSDGIACTVDACDESVDSCLVAEDEDCECEVGSDCDDAKACNGVETCGADRVCHPGTAITCPPAPSVCLDNVCRDSDGACVQQAVNEGGACSDGAFCTIDDRCLSGACVGDPRSCDDGRICSLDSCSEELDQCAFDLDACNCLDDGDCDNHDACDGVETCGVDGKCVAGTPVVCEPSTQPCTRSECVPETGACATVDDDDASCSDADPCTTGDICSGGVCVASVVSCDDGVDCTTDGCDSTTGACVHVPTTGDDGCECTDASMCNDGNSCNGAEACDPIQFECVPGTPRDDGVACQDGQVCSVNDHCEAGQCVGDERVCDDGIACTVDACSETGGGCVADLSACGCSGIDDTSCEDGLACNGITTCGPQNMCVAGTPITCEPSQVQCKKTRCNDVTGGCDLVDDDAASCSDGDACTTNDRCFGGECVGTEIVCDDGIECTADYCDAGGRCRATPTDACDCTIDADCYDDNACDGLESCNLSSYTCVEGAPLPDGKGCDDGLFCTYGDECQGQVCVSGGPRSCSDGHACSPDSCDESNDVCVSVTVGHCSCLEDADCGDGDACNGVETCNPQGECEPGTPVTCQQPQNVCQQALCDVVTGQCYYSARADGTDCEDGSDCTVGDECLAGQCQSGAVCPDRVCFDPGSGTCEGGTCAYTHETIISGTSCGSHGAKCGQCLAGQWGCQPSSCF